MGSAVFQAGGLVVVLVEVARKAYLASIVPVIVNAILNEHQIIVDIVAFVNKGDFPRSRLGEKQRGKILAGWVTRKMRTMAQFGIRDTESALSDVTETVEARTSTHSIRNGSVITGSLRNIEMEPTVPEERDLEREHENISTSPPPEIAEMPAETYADSVQELPGRENDTTKSDDTPRIQSSSHFALPGINISSAIDEPAASQDEQDNDATYALIDSYQYPPVLSDPEPLPPRVGPKPTATLPPPQAPSPPPPAIAEHQADLWSLPSQRVPPPFPPPKIPLDVASQEEEEWPQEAIMHMNFAAHSRSHSREGS